VGFNTSGDVTNDVSGDATSAGAAGLAMLVMPILTMMIRRCRKA
jgi:hypothetical protein